MTPYTYAGIDRQNQDPQYFVNSICELLGLKIEDIKGKSRKHHIVCARFVIVNNLISRFDMRYDVAGTYINRDHSTITHYFNNMKQSAVINEYDYLIMTNLL